MGQFLKKLLLSLLCLMALATESYAMRRTPGQEEPVEPPKPSATFAAIKASVQEQRVEREKALKTVEDLDCNNALKRDGTSGPLDEEEQKALLKTLEGSVLTRVKLANSTVLDSRIFFETLQTNALTHLTLTGSSAVSNAFVAALPSACQDLVTLDLSHSPQLERFGNRTLWYFASFVVFPKLKEARANDCPKLQEFTLKGDNLELVEFKRTPLYWLSLGGKSVKHIAMDGSLALLDSALDPLAETCPALESMSCEECTQLINSKFRARFPRISSTAVRLIMKEEGNSVDAILSKDSPVALGFTDTHINRHVAKQLTLLPLITHLTFKNVRMGEHAVRILFSIPTLVTADLSSYNLVTFDGELDPQHNISLPLVLTSMESLSVSGCGALQSIKVVAHRLRTLNLTTNPLLAVTEIISDSLENLTLCSLRKLGDEALDYVAVYCSKLSSITTTLCPSLKYPELRNKVPEFCQAPFSLDILCRINTAIKGQGPITLSLDGTYINSQMVEGLSGLPLLTTLSLSGCPMLEQFGVDLLLSPLSFPHLTHLHMSRCNSLQSLAFKGKALTVLSLRDNPKLSSMTLQCPKLQSVHLDRSPLIRVSQVKPLITNCKDLDTITKEGCVNLKLITDDVLKCLKGKKPITLTFKDGTLDQRLAEDIAALSPQSLKFTVFTVEKDGIEVLASSSSLQHLAFQNCTIDRKVLRATKGISSLSELFLVDSNLGDRGAQAIVNILKERGDLTIRVQDKTINDTLNGLIKTLQELRPKSK